MRARPAQRAAPGRHERRRPRYRAVAGLVLLSLLGTGLAGGAWAQTARSRFSADEQAVIARNASLRTASATAPAAVRRALDALAAGTARAGAALGPDPETPQDGFDPTVDPDLAALQRVSPEAAHDIFQVLKQVGTASPIPPPRPKE